jgi:hypothetical protein
MGSKIGKSALKWENKVSVGLKTSKFIRHQIYRLRSTRRRTLVDQSFRSYDTFCYSAAFSLLAFLSPLQLDPLMTQTILIAG